MNLSADDLKGSLEAAGFRARIVPVGRLRDLEHEIQALRREIGIDPVLDRDYLSSFRFSSPADLPHARSMIVVAAPQPQVDVTFQFRGNPVLLRIPPTYMHHTDGQVEKALRKALKPAGCRSSRGHVPEKMLAVRSGLARYGKNNVSYVPEFGSFHRLAVFFSDFAVGEDIWKEETTLDRCGSCQACITACPTGAIRNDRFLIRAERCLSFLNERPGAFPDWIDPSWHNCLVGCMRCQEACPENRGVVGWVERKGMFSEEETELLLSGAGAGGRLPEEIRKKLETLDLIEYKNWLYRNLQVLVR